MLLKTFPWRSKSFTSLASINPKIPAGQRSKIGLKLFLNQSYVLNWRVWWFVGYRTSLGKRLQRVTTKCENINDKVLELISLHSTTEWEWYNSITRSNSLLLDSETVITKRENSQNEKSVVPLSKEDHNFRLKTSGGGSKDWLWGQSEPMRQECVVLQLCEARFLCSSVAVLRFSAARASVVTLRRQVERSLQLANDSQVLGFRLQGLCGTRPWGSIWNALLEIIASLWRGKPVTWSENWAFC